MLAVKRQLLLPDAVVKPSGHVRSSNKSARGIPSKTRLIFDGQFPPNKCDGGGQRQKVGSMNAQPGNSD